ncbi:MAG: Thiamine-monophosphate kinase [Desulfovibrio sp.]
MNSHYITSEDDFLALIAAAFPNTHPSLILGRGDDCAEIACPPQMAVSTDLFVEDAHFRQRYFTPYETGYKALAVNISDMAAAGAKPLGVSVGLTVPVPFNRENAAGIIAGMAEAAAKFDIALTGGDLSRGEKLAFCVTIWGAPAPDAAAPSPADRAFLRRGPVREGDALFLCGEVGLARAGLLLLEEKGRAALHAYPVCCRAHLMPEPLVTAGLVLARHSSCRLMDVSDGLLRDLPRMLRAYGVSFGAAIALPEDMLHPETTRYAHETGEDPALFAFTGGEDYALLGACPQDEFAVIKEAVELLPEAPRVARIGTVTTRPGLVLNGAPLSAAGFDHFR